MDHRLDMNVFDSAHQNREKKYIHNLLEQTEIWKKLENRK